MGKTKKITNLIIIDASSSMSRKSDEIIGGLIELFTDIKKDMKETDAKIRTIICQFAGAGSFKVILDTKKRGELKKSIAKAYAPSGMTALYDAIGNGFNLVGKKQDGVFVSILTDGEENDSKEYKLNEVKELISAADEKKWGITFMGTSQEALFNAQSLGVKAGNMFMYADSSDGTKLSSVSRLKSKGMYFRSVMTADSLDDVQTDNLVDDVDAPSTDK